MTHVLNEELISCLSMHDVMMNIAANIDLDSDHRYEYCNYCGRRLQRQIAYEMSTLLALDYLCPRSPSL